MSGILSLCLLLGVPCAGSDLAHPSRVAQPHLMAAGSLPIRSANEGWGAQLSLLAHWRVREALGSRPPRGAHVRGPGPGAGG